ncbi:hypothetical protein [Acidianus ambivalens]|uniref:Uncharacterized protein n=1 Tax=Acidianus ambivalens TaxID=2283 RepID=A0A650CXE1_ACIAM|nr:hypothetical protein [Acidianus ambivalens]MQL54300.1 hypothetical protein [Acidianus ambivalens]QGR22127.1 hypothetical protein D1866_09165 [Acidianus ambivalens]
MKSDVNFDLKGCHSLGIIVDNQTATFVIDNNYKLSYNLGKLSSNSGKIYIAGNSGVEAST